MSIFDIIGGAAKAVGGLVEAVFKGVDSISTTEEEKLAFKSDILKAQQKFELDMATIAANVEAERAKVVVAEAQGESFLQRSWRPITMLTFVAIIANNYIIAPYVSAFGGFVPTLEIPQGMWALLNVGIGGYIASRGVEKVFQIRANGNGKR